MFVDEHKLGRILMSVNSKLNVLLAAQAAQVTATQNIANAVAGIKGADGEALQASVDSLSAHVSALQSEIGNDTDGEAASSGSGSAAPAPAGATSSASGTGAQAAQ